MPVPDRVPDQDRSSADDRAIGVAKGLLRKAVLLRRDSRPDEQRRADDQARMHLIERLLPRPPATVAAYLSTGSEPDSRRLVAWLAAQDVRVLLPVLTAPDGSWLSDPAWADYARPEDLRIGRASILEPTGPALPATEVAEANLVVCPGLAATRSGDRLGRGGAWYDRALGHTTGAPTWVLLNDDEVLDTIPVQPWDRRVDTILTATAVVDCAADPA